MPSRLENRRGVYLITPDLDDTRRLLALCEDLLTQPVALFQYRNKSASAGLKHRQASALLASCRKASRYCLI